MRSTETYLKRAVLLGAILFVEATTFEVENLLQGETGAAIPLRVRLKRQP